MEQAIVPLFYFYVVCFVSRIVNSNLNKLLHIFTALVCDVIIAKVEARDVHTVSQCAIQYMGVVVCEANAGHVLVVASQIQTPIHIGIPDCATNIHKRFLARNLQKLNHVWFDL